MIQALRREVAELTRAMSRVAAAPEPASRAVRQDTLAIMMLWRVRCFARRTRIPLVNHLLRRVQSVWFGIELGNEIELGQGIFFVHPVGIVVGGNARVGDRVVFMGSNTIGTAKGNGCPILEDDVVVGAGARVLGPIRIGARAVIGANAVVLEDVPPDSVAVGVPARIVGG